MKEKRGGDDQMPPSTMHVSDNSAISMPIRNLISIVLAVGRGVWGYFGVVERLNRLETTEQLVKKDLQTLEKELNADIQKNNEFRIKWPRGEMGQPPADGEQFMLIEHLSGQLEKIQKRIEDMLNNGVNITRLKEDVKTLRADIEKLKDRQRGLMNGGSSHK